MRLIQLSLLLILLLWFQLRLVVLDKHCHIVFVFFHLLWDMLHGIYNTMGDKVEIVGSVHSRREGSN